MSGGADHADNLSSFPLRESQPKKTRLVLAAYIWHLAITLPRSLEGNEMQSVVLLSTVNNGRVKHINFLLMLKRSSESMQIPRFA